MMTIRDCIVLLIPILSLITATLSFIITVIWIRKQRKYKEQLRKQYVYLQHSYAVSIIKQFLLHYYYNRTPLMDDGILLTAIAINMEHINMTTISRVGQFKIDDTKESLEDKIIFVFHELEILSK